MKAREFQNLLSDLSGQTLDQVDQRTRFLRELNLIPHGPRGPHAPDIEPAHAAVMLLTLAACRPADAKDTTIAMTKAKCAEGESFYAMLSCELGNANSVLSKIDVDSEGAYAVAYFGASGAKAVLYTDDVRLREAVAKAGGMIGSAITQVNHVFQVPRTALNLIRDSLLDVEGGWSADREDK